MKTVSDVSVIDWKKRWKTFIVGNLFQNVTKAGGENTAFGLIVESFTSFFNVFKNSETFSKKVHHRGEFPP